MVVSSSLAVEGPRMACGAGRRLLTAPLHVPVSWRGKTEPCLLLLQNLSFCHRPATPIITYSPQNGITVLAKGRRSRSFYMNVVTTGKCCNIYLVSGGMVDFKVLMKFALSLSLLHLLHPRMHL